MLKAIKSSAYLPNKNSFIYRKFFDGLKHLVKKSKGNHTLIDCIVERNVLPGNYLGKSISVIFDELQIPEKIN